MGELYVSFSPGNLTENGYYVNMFSENRASECLTIWMLENGGLVSNTHHCSIVSVKRRSNATNATICISANTP